MQFNSEQVNETEVDRVVKVEDSKAVIDSEVKQTVDCDTFMEMFKQKLTKHQQLKRQIRDMQNQIEQLLDERERDMQNLHAIDSSEDQNKLAEDAARGSAVNSVPFEAIETYVQLKKARNQQEQQQAQLEDVREDLPALAEGARTIVENYDSFEMPEIWEQKVKEDLEDE